MEISQERIVALVVIESLHLESMWEFDAKVWENCLGGSPRFGLKVMPPYSHPWRRESMVRAPWRQLVQRAKMFTLADTRPAIVTGHTPYCLQVWAPRGGYYGPQVFKALLDMFFRTVVL